MESDSILRGRAFVVGERQVKKTAEIGGLTAVILARDADKAFTDRVKAVAARYNVPLQRAATMDALGREAGISVPAAVVGILKI
jgi:ribosomal protein L7Ae-like RNA K-turn-binding protein